jgi:hypothetical protein
LDQAAHDIHTAQFGQPNLATPAQMRAAIGQSDQGRSWRHAGQAFLAEEWAELVDAWHVVDGDAYAAVPRIGRRTRLGPHQREAAWSVFAFVRQALTAKRLITWAGYDRLAQWLGQGGAPGFSHVVVDEAQDLSVAQVRFLARLAKVRPDGLFLAGDIGQRIFHLPFSWARLGLDVRGRSHSLKVNYRTSHQISGGRPATATADQRHGRRRGRAARHHFRVRRTRTSRWRATRPTSRPAWLRSCSSAWPIAVPPRKSRCWCAVTASWPGRVRPRRPGSIPGPMTASPLPACTGGAGIPRRCGDGLRSGRAA